MPKKSFALLIGLGDCVFKFIHFLVDPPQLFDLASGPDEMQNLVKGPAWANKMAHFIGLMNTKWDLKRFDAEVRKSHARRHEVYAAWY